MQKCGCISASPSTSVQTSKESASEKHVNNRITAVQSGSLCELYHLGAHQLKCIRSVRNYQYNQFYKPPLTKPLETTRLSQKEAGSAESGVLSIFHQLQEGVCVLLYFYLCEDRFEI